MDGAGATSKGSFFSKPSLSASVGDSTVAAGAGFDGSFRPATASAGVDPVSDGAAVDKRVIFVCDIHSSTLGVTTLERLLPILQMEDYAIFSEFKPMAVEEQTFCEKLLLEVPGIARAAKNATANDATKRKITAVYLQYKGEPPRPGAISEEVVSLVLSIISQYPAKKTYLEFVKKCEIMGIPVIRIDLTPGDPRSGKDAIERTNAMSREAWNQLERYPRACIFAGCNHFFDLKLRTSDRIFPGMRRQLSDSGIVIEKALFPIESSAREKEQQWLVGESSSKFYPSSRLELEGTSYVSETDAPPVTMEQLKACGYSFDGFFVLPSMLVRYKLESELILPTPEKALRRAARMGKIDDVHFLIRYSDVNAKEESGKGRTALHIAVEHGKLEIAQALIENGADITIKDNGEKMASEYVTESSPPGFTELFSMDEFTVSHGRVRPGK